MDTLTDMVTETVSRNISYLPRKPGSLYLRPMLLGTDVDIGGVTVPSRNAKLLVIACPEGDYFSESIGAFSLEIVDDRQRAVGGIAGIKAVAICAGALNAIVQARKYCGAHDVLFFARGPMCRRPASRTLRYT